jgi:hypothetical protein
MVESISPITTIPSCQVMSDGELFRQVDLPGAARVVRQPARMTLFTARLA